MLLFYPKWCWMIQVLMYHNPHRNHISIFEAYVHIILALAKWNDRNRDQTKRKFQRSRHDAYSFNDVPFDFNTNVFSIARYFRINFHSGLMLFLLAHVWFLFIVLHEMVQVTPTEIQKRKKNHWQQRWSRTSIWQITQCSAISYTR